ncbi:putative 3-methyladenine DNA glycosylase [Kineosphaera limosa NBRC 100340]|uniref:Putative 3-methyladenine DNA glycosylase n=2 Tax=Kineosphaera TaxID=211469 RepID=K6VJ50_9MICO|nr:putative 3-methyladenine DNA glycosylase [Kineosphaera limosa NBRC 100340]
MDMSAQFGPPLTAEFFDRPVLQVAPEVLGCVVTHGPVAVRLTEVEAYDGADDPGSHAFRGQTPRTEAMFGPPGGLYVYFTYGMHFCANLVCGPAGRASAVLMRAGEVIAGQSVATDRRTRPGKAAPKQRDLARGPARLASALGLDREQNGLFVTGGGPVTVHAPAQRAPEEMATGPRVGVSGPGGDAQDFPWRFWSVGEPTVSVYRPGVRRSERRGLSGRAGGGGATRRGQTRP